MSRTTGHTRPPLLLVAVTVVLGVTAADLLVRLAVEIAAGRVGLDFAYDLAAARLGLQHGWAAVYDRHLYGVVTNHGDPLSYANTPVIALLAVPFTALPFRVGMALWTLPLLVALVAAWWLAAPGGPWQRAAHLFALLAAAPILFGISIGQFSLAVTGLLALHWWLVGRGRPLLAGVALGFAFLKPQDAFLVPVALALTGRCRCAAAWAATVAGLALTSALVLGPAGVEAYADQLVHHSLDSVTTAYTLGPHLPAWLPSLPVRAVVAVLGLIPALLDGRERYGRALAAAIAGSLLATPYLNWQDLGQLILAGWLVLDSAPPRWLRWAFVPGYLAVAYPAGPLPPLCTALLGLMALAWLAVAGHASRSHGSRLGRHADELPAEAVGRHGDR